MRYLSLLSFTEDTVEIAQAEAKALVGASLFEGRLAFSAAAGDVTHAAHINWCAEELARSPSLKALCERFQAEGFRCEQFKVIVVKPPEGVPMKSHEIAGELAAHIQGWPDLDNPKTQLALAFTSNEVLLGQIVSEADKSWQRHVRRPHEYSNALPARLARAVVNMVVRPGDRVLDPLCGSGTLLIEAASIGARVWGSDANWRMAAAARENLAYFGLQGHIEVAEAQAVRGAYDVVVTDLPYGRTSRTDEGLYRAVLGNVVQLAPRAAIVMGGPYASLLEAVGYEITHVARQRKGTLVRHVYVCRSRVAAGPSKGSEGA